MTESLQLFLQIKQGIDIKVVWAYSIKIKFLYKCEMLKLHERFNIFALNVRSPRITTPSQNSFVEF